MTVPSYPISLVIADDHPVVLHGVVVAVKIAQVA